MNSLFGDLFKELWRGTSEVFENIYGTMLEFFGEVFGFWQGFRGIIRD